MTEHPTTPPQAMPALHHNHPEADDRSDAPALPWKPKFSAKFAAMPEAWRELITEAKQMQDLLGLPDPKFVGPVMGGSSYNQLVNGAYPVPTTRRGISQITAKLEMVVQRGNQLLRDARQSQGQPQPLRLIPRPELEDAIAALDEAQTRLERDIEERLVILIGPTRAGKSCLIRQLMEAGRVHWRFRALPSMKVRYREFLEGMAQSVAMRKIDSRDTTELEAALLAKFSEVPAVLAIEELQRFSKRSLEFLKALLNETQVSLLLAIKPGEWAAITRTQNEDMQQFLGRCVVRIDLHVTAQLVREYVEHLWPTGSDMKACQAVADAAELGGGMSLVREVADNARTFAGSRAVSAEHVTAALKAYRQGVPELRHASAVFGRSKALKAA